MRDGHIHVTEKKEEIALYNMADSHLMNTIRMIARKFAEKGRTVVNPRSLLDAVMEPSEGDGTRKGILRDAIKDVYPNAGRYVLEALRRELDVVEAAQPIFNVLNALKEFTPDDQLMLAEETYEPEEPED